MLKRFAFILAMLFMSFGLIGCLESPDRTESMQTLKLREEALRQVGLPNIQNFQQKKTLKMIQELCDQEDLICYAYLQSEYTGKLVFIGKCVGYGIPFSAQYTNPVRITSGHTLPQPDPNGLFMPTSSSATWLLLIDPKTSKPRVVYCEPLLVISPFPLPDSVVIGGSKS